MQTQFQRGRGVQEPDHEGAGLGGRPRHPRGQQGRPRADHEVRADRRGRGARREVRVSLLRDERRAPQTRRRRVPHARQGDQVSLLHHHHHHHHHNLHHHHYHHHYQEN